MTIESLIQIYEMKESTARKLYESKKGTFGESIAKTLWEEKKQFLDDLREVDA